jgi:hypothetical protein
MNSDDNTERRLQRPTAPKVLDLAEPRDAQFVVASLVSPGTTRGEPRFVPRSALIASELAGKLTAIGWAGSKSPSTCCHRTARRLNDGPDLTTRQGILETARTLIRAAKTMTDSAIAGQPKAPLPGTTSGQLSKLRMSMRPKHSLYRLLALNASGVPGINADYFAAIRMAIITAADELRE